MKLVKSFLQDKSCIGKAFCYHRKQLSNNLAQGIHNSYLPSFPQKRMKKLLYTLLTFYKFVDISDPQQEVKDHVKFCKDIGLKGRIYIGEE